MKACLVHWDNVAGSMLIDQINTLRRPVAYESNMIIFFDPIEKWVVVSFRDTVKVLPGRFANRKEAVASAEAYCREQGWLDDRVPSLSVAVNGAA